MVMILCGFITVSEPFDIINSKKYKIGRIERNELQYVALVLAT